MIEVKPDIAFIEKLQAYAGSQLTTCMQCGACTASCSLSEDQNVFPRRQMIMAAWGLKDHLMADPNVWTCHQCGDCTVSCPRGVKPGEILTALRQEQIAYYSKPGFLVRWMQNPKFLPLVLLFPAVIIILILSLAGTFKIPEGPVDYSKFFPHGWLNGSFTALFVLSTSGAVSGILKFWKNIKAGQTGSVRTTGSRSFIQVILNILLHRDFNRCGEQRHRRLAHFMVLWGFVLLLFVTAFAILSTLLFEYPLGFLNPIKIAGNTGAIMLLTGTSLMIFNRLLKPDAINSNYADWFFLVSFWMLTVSGILVEAARFLEWSSAYHLYFFHLVMVWIIILYFPYTKFAHFLYRTIALILIKSTNPSNT